MKWFLFPAMVLIVSTNVLSQRISNRQYEFDADRMKSVVPIHVEDEMEKFLGTGFLVYYKDADIDFDTTFLVTNEHVIRGYEGVLIYLNLTEPAEALVGDTYSYSGTVWKRVGSRMRATIKVKDKSAPLYFTHPTAEYDLAVLPLSLPYRIGETDIFDIDKLDYYHFAFNQDIELSQRAYMIGFPNGYGSIYSEDKKVYLEPRSVPYLRFGYVSWLKDGSNEYALDLYSHGGDSGSPVYSYLHSDKRTYLIGINVGHLYKIEPVYKQQGGGKTAGTEYFVEENLKYTHCIKAVVIDQVIKYACKQLVQ